MTRVAKAIGFGSNYATVFPPEPGHLPTFIDESGDPGVNEGSSPHFCLALVYFETIEDAENCRETIKHFRKVVLKKGERHEFKSSMGRVADHEEFFRHLDKCIYYYSYCQVDKNVIENRSLSKEYVIELATQGLASAVLEFYKIAELSKGAPLNERVLHDYHTDPAYTSAIRDAFVALKSDRKPGASLVKSVKSGRSSGDDLLQLADMVCGAVRRGIQEGKSTCYQLIKKKELTVFSRP